MILRSSSASGLNRGKTGKVVGKSLVWNEFAMFYNQEAIAQPVSPDGIMYRYYYGRFFSGFHV
jgi:hypothetical protein